MMVPPRRKGGGFFYIEPKPKNLKHKKNGRISRGTSAQRRSADHRGVGRSSIDTPTQKELLKINHKSRDFCWKQQSPLLFCNNRFIKDNVKDTTGDKCPLWFRESPE
jgi:hypothetical protein